MVGAPLAAAAEAPGRGYRWGTTAVHATLPRGAPRPVEPAGTLEEILVGPADEADGRRNLLGGLRRRWRPGTRPQGVPEGRAWWLAGSGARTSARGTCVGEPRPRHRPGRRLRRAVRPAHRPPCPRGARLQRDRAAHDARGGDAGPAARRHRPVRRPLLRVRRRGAERRPGAVRGRRAHLRHLLRLPGDGPALDGTVERTGLAEFGRTDLTVTAPSRPSSAGCRPSSRSG